MKFLKRLFLYLIPLVLAFSTMIVANEYYRATMPDNQKSRETLKMNTTVAQPDACSWKCYHDTGYCKRNHVKLGKDYFRLIDPLYFGMISALLMTGNYGAANLLFLVVLWPLLLSYLLVKPILIQLQIKKLNKQHV